MDVTSMTYLVKFNLSNYFKPRISGNNLARKENHHCAPGAPAYVKNFDRHAHTPLSGQRQGLGADIRRLKMVLHAVTEQLVSPVRSSRIVS